MHAHASSRKLFALTVLGLALAAALSGPTLARAEEIPPGMKPYVLALLYRGKAWTSEPTDATHAIQEGHMANIRRLAAEGKLLLAGPFTEDGDLLGLFLFDVATVAEAQALCDTDPAVKAGRLRVELHPWLGAAVIHADATPPK